MARNMPDVVLRGSRLLLALVCCSACTANIFDGNYSDPNHPGCKRTIVVLPDGQTGNVSGADAAGGEGAACDGKTDVPWGPLKAYITMDPPPEEGGSIHVDFSPKGGPGSLKGEHSSGKITWPDGNSWRRSGVVVVLRII